MLASMMLPLFIVSPFFFVITFPIICLLESSINIKYLRIDHDFYPVLKIMIGINGVSSILSILLIILIESISSWLGHEISYQETITFLNNYKSISVIALYLLTVLVEWICMRFFLANLKINRRKMLHSSFLANAASYSITVPIFYRFFL